MGLILVLLLMALAWVALTGTFSAINFLFGLALGYFALWLIREQIGMFGVLKRMNLVLRLFGLFLYEMFLSALRVAVLVIKPDIKPGIISFPLKVDRSFEITMLANMITLTPGTLSVDVSGDNSTLYIHVIDISDADRVRKGIAEGFERMILEAFQ